MTRGTFATTVALAGALNLVGMTAALAGPPYDEMRPLFNPRYVPPYPEGPWGHVPLCQVLVRVSPPMSGVSSDDMFYCYLPPYASRQASDPCACAQTTNGGRFLRSGMVVWTPGWWRYPVYPHP